MEWTKEYCGVQHLGKPNQGKTWFTVERHKTFADLSEWYPGCGFHPIDTTYGTVEEAKQAAEARMQLQNIRGCV